MLVLLTASAVRAELITNGTFETPTVADYVDESFGSTAVSGWTLGSTTGAAQKVEIIANWRLVNLGLPHDGTQVLQLGTCNYISQTLATMAGETYTISLDLAGRDYAASTIVVAFGNVSETLTTSSKTAFATYTFTAAATSDSTTLTISNTTAINTSSAANNRVFVDNVSVASVPEPSTIALLIAGALGLICFAWRKRR
jgi:hypothetical protein